MTGIIIKRYRPEEFPRHLDFLERMTVTKGTVEDWHALKSLHFERLKGKREGQHSVRLNAQWRLVLEIQGKSPCKIVGIIEIVDYH